MSIEYIQTRPIPVGESDVVDVAKKIAQGLAPSVVANRAMFQEGKVYKISETPALREEIEVLDDGTAVYRLMPSRQRLRSLGLRAGRGMAYHLPHDRTVIALRGPGVGANGNIIGVLVHRNGVKRL
ncbi:MAG: hypothetical protein AAB532_00785 [Patescibacteria group bacterium]